MLYVLLWLVLAAVSVVSSFEFSCVGGLNLVPQKTSPLAWGLVLNRFV